MKFALAFILCLIPAVARAGEVSYEQAYAEAQQGQPLVVVASAPWCGACHALIARMRQEHRHFVVLDIDHPLSAAIRKRYFSGGHIPQVSVTQKIFGEWRTWRER